MAPSGSNAIENRNAAQVGGSRYIIEVIRSDATDTRKFEIDAARKKVFRYKTRSIEIDVVTDRIHDVVEEISRLSEITDIRGVGDEPAIMNPGLDEYYGGLLKCEILSRQERFWECHTVLEKVWMHSAREYKLFLQSIILLSSSQAKYQMLNQQAAERMYERALSMLDRSGKSSMVLTQIGSKFYYPIKWRFDIPDNIRASTYLKYFVGE